MADLLGNRKGKPGICMRHRDENTEAAGLPGNRKGRGPEAYPLGYGEVTSPEDAGRVGRIRGRSRWFMHNPGVNPSRTHRVRRGSEDRGRRVKWRDLRS